MPTNRPRLYYADWLRILAVFLLIPFHTAIIFVPPGPLTYVRELISDSGWT
jgi:peptidoglycan/LPS O-acetylase OafA/YrhL